MIMKPMIEQALAYLRTWQPFRIDALGLITLLGASELDSTIGQLFSPCAIEMLPLLAPFVVTNNGFMKPIAGVTLYNITDGILATDVSGWVARWLLNRDMSWNSATLIISACPPFRTESRIRSGRLEGRVKISKPYRLWTSRLLRVFSLGRNQVTSIAMGLASMLPVLLMPIFQEDWFGLVNAIALLMTVATRILAVRLNRKAVFLSVAEGLGTSDRGREMVKLAITLPGGRFVTVYCQRGIVKHTIMTAPRPEPWNNKLVLGISWIALSCHLVSIGMATLIDQMICIVALVASTLLYVALAQGARGKTNGGVVFRLGDGPGGMLWRLSQAHEDGRSAAYARLAMTEDEERTMCNWHLFPAKSNHIWWEKYYERSEHAQNRLRV
jgi:hypothetical protein